MAAYMIAFVDVKDAARYGDYMKHTPRVIAEHGGRMLVRGGNAVAIEGELPGPRCVVVEFNDRNGLMTFYNSQAYQGLKAVRANAAIAHFVAVDGLDPKDWQAMVATSQSAV